MLVQLVFGNFPISVCNCSSICSKRRAVALTLALFFLCAFSFLYPVFKKLRGKLNFGTVNTIYISYIANIAYFI